MEDIKKLIGKPVGRVNDYVIREELSESEQVINKLIDIVKKQDEMIRELYSYHSLSGSVVTGGEI